MITVLLTEHGIEPTSVKSDLYTLLGIDSNHPSKLRSTIWRPAEVIQGGNDAIKVCCKNASTNKQALKTQYKPAKEAAYKAAANTAVSSAPKASPPAEATKSVSFEEVTTNTSAKRKEADLDVDNEKKTPKMIKRVKSKA